MLKLEASGFSHSTEDQIPEDESVKECCEDVPDNHTTK